MFHYHLQPSELEAMPYHELEYAFKDLIDILKERKQAEEGGSDQSQQATAPPNPAGMMADMRKQASSMMKGVPKFPGLPSSLRSMM